LVIIAKTEFPYCDAYDAQSIYLQQGDDIECDVNTIRTLNIVSTALSSVQDTSSHHFVFKQVAFVRGRQVLLFAGELKSNLHLASQGKLSCCAYQMSLGINEKIYKEKTRVF
jgi:hypothetical protein